MFYPQLKEGEQYPLDDSAYSGFLTLNIDAEKMLDIYRASLVLKENPAFRKIEIDLKQSTFMNNSDSKVDMLEYMSAVLEQNGDIYFYGYLKYSGDIVKTELISL